MEEQLKEEARRRFNGTALKLQGRVVGRIVDVVACQARWANMAGRAVIETSMGTEEVPVVLGDANWVGYQGKHLRPHWFTPEWVGMLIVMGLTRQIAASRAESGDASPAALAAMVTGLV